MPANWTSVDSERRGCPRQVVNTLVYVDLGQDNGGILHNLSEDGLAMTTAFPLQSSQVIRLGFKLETNAHIEGSGRVAWIDESGKHAGLEFVDLSDTSYQQLRDWLSLRAASGAVVGGLAAPPRAEGAERLEPSPSPTETQARAVHRYEQAAELRRALTQPSKARSPVLSQPTVSRVMALGSRQKIGLLLGFFVVLGCIFALGYVMTSRHYQPQVRTTEPAIADPARPATTPQAPAAPQLNAATTNPSLHPPLIPHGAIVLQVAALTHEPDARALAETLRQKQFPAFVPTPTTNHYYRVQVGPYANAKSARSSRRALEREGFKVIIKHR